MASRTAYVATESVGDVLTKANFDKLPGGLIGYASVTAAQNTITTLVDLTSLTVTVTVNTSRLIRIQGVVVYSAINGATQGDLLIRESSTVIGNVGSVILSATGNTATCIVDTQVTAPSSGSHTYKLSAQANNNGVNMIASANPGSIYSSPGPAWIRVWDDGPTF